MNQVILLTITMSFWGMEQSVHPVLLKDEHNLVLVDCGFVSALPHLEASIREKGLDPADLTHLVLTHHDHDHMGAVAALKEKYPQVKILASELEEPYISGKQKSPRLVQAEELHAYLPDEQKAFGDAFQKLLRSVKPVPVDGLLHDGDLLDWCGGCKIMATPGHTPGHISLVLPELSTVIAGDAAAIEDGKPAIANPQFTLDTEQATASLKKVLACGMETLICYHGGIWKPSSVQ